MCRRVEAHVRARPALLVLLLVLGVSVLLTPASLARSLPLFFQVSVTLVEASNHLLGTFDRRLVDYVGQVFHERKVRVLTDTSVVKVRIAKGVGSGERRLMRNVQQICPSTEILPRMLHDSLNPFVSLPPFLALGGTQRRLAQRRHSPPFWALCLEHWRESRSSHSIPPCHHSQGERRTAPGRQPPASQGTGGQGRLCVGRLCGL